MILTFDVTNQRLVRTDNNKTVEKSQNYLECKFNFISSDWDGMTKAVLFKNTDMENPVIRILEDDICKFPNGVPIGSCNIAVVGGGIEDITNIAENKAITQTGVMITTNTVCIPFDDTLDADNITDWSNPDSGFADFLNMLKKHSSSAVIDHADGSVTENKLAKALKDKINGKVDKLTFDEYPTDGSNNAVKSSGIKSALDNKVDKQTADGGFKAGENAYTEDSGIAIGTDAFGTYTGIAIGQYAKGSFGGVSIGTGAEAVDGCSVSIGQSSYANGSGTAIGSGAKASGNGFSGGLNAETIDGEKFIDAVQLGTGTNPNLYTAQIYDYQLIADDAEEPSATDGSKYLKDVGKLSSLQTTAKADIVSAINELKTQVNILHGFGTDFWTGFFKTGRTDFSYAFINNGATEIKPTQVINAAVIKYMLLNCSELIDGSSIVVNLTADNPIMVGVCMGCLKLTKPPVINITSENAHVCRSYVSAYANCAKLTQCTIWFGDGTQSASGERTDMANTFLNCSSLTSLTFTGSGSPKNLDLSVCKQLSNESIQSLHTALMDVSTVTSGTYKITINSEIQTKITALNLDFAAKGWTLEIKQEEMTNA